MCNPLAFGLGAAQAVSSYAGAQGIARAQEAAQRRASLAENERLRSAQISLRQQQAEQAEARSQRIQESEIRARRARARAMVAAGSAGISGQNLDAVVNDLTMQEGKYLSSEERRAEMQDSGIAIQLEQETIASGMNQLRINRPIEQPSILNSAISGATTGLNFANALGNLTRTT